MSSPITEYFDNNSSHESLDEKRKIVTERLHKRDNDRKADTERRKEERESQQAENERIDVFDSNFNDYKINIENQISKIELANSNDFRKTLNIISQEILKLQKYFNDSVPFLPAGRIQFNQNIIKKLEQDLLFLEEKLIPKKKFAFKKATRIQGPMQSNLQVNQDISSMTNLEICGFTLTNKSNKTVILNDIDITTKDVLISNMNDCIVKILGNPATIHMTNIENCTILSGPASSSVFIDSAKLTTFALSAQQLRIHKTIQCDFYIHVTSRAIIEDSNKLRFSPYSLSYPGLEEHYKSSGLNKSMNNWSLINDFNWLTNSEKSPNWCEIPIEERKIFTEN